MGLPGLGEDENQKIRIAIRYKRLFTATFDGETYQLLLRTSSFIMEINELTTTPFSKKFRIVYIATPLPFILSTILRGM